MNLSVADFIKEKRKQLNLTQPEKVANIARSYLEAGAELLATNSFNANRISQSDYGMEARVGEINAFFSLPKASAAR